jgi:hypothetical protein
METPRQLAARLFTALDELAGQEGTYLRGGHYGHAIAARNNAAPLVARLVGLASEPGMEDFQARAAGLAEISRGHELFLRDKMKDLTAEIVRVDQARRRTVQLAPVYARVSGAAVPRFQAAG